MCVCVCVRVSDQTETKPSDSLCIGAQGVRASTAALLRRVRLGGRDRTPLQVTNYSKLDRAC